MKVLLKLYSTEDQAADGSMIPRSSTEEYLLSDDYKIIIRDKIALGGVTHKDRRLSAEYKGIVGCDDQVLINDNATHYFTKIFMKGPEDPFVYGIIEIFDPEKFTGKRKETIVNLIGMLQSGVKLPVSIVIHALWDARNIAQKIIRIKGVDFTQNNSFPNAGTEKIFSEGVKDLEEGFVQEEKEYSVSEEHAGLYPGCRCFTRTFSAEVVSMDENKIDVEPTDKLAKETLELPKEVSEGEDHLLSRSEIVKKYGLNSYESYATKGFSAISESELRKLTAQLKESDPEQLIIQLGNTKAVIPVDGDVEEIQEALNETLKSADPDFIQNVFRSNRNKFVQMLQAVPKDDPNRKNTLREMLMEYFRNVPNLAVFSTIDSVTDRMYMAKYPRLILIKRIMTNYKQFYQSKGTNFDTHQENLFQSLVIQDLTLLMRSVASKIKEGATLNTIYGVHQFNDEAITNSATELSKIYRQVLIAESILQFIPQDKYKTWTKALTNFFSACLSWIEQKPVNITTELVDRFTK